MKKIAIIALILSLTTLTFAGENEILSENHTKTELVKSCCIKGQVIDKDTGESLAGVVISTGDVKVYSDFDGNFIIDNLTLGSHTLKCNMISYKEKTFSVESESANITIYIEQINQ